MDLRNVGKNPPTISTNDISMMAVRGLSVINQSRSAIPAITRLAQSTTKIFLSPRLSERKKIRSVMQKVKPICHDPGPPLLVTCTANAIPDNDAHTSHDKACGLVFPLKMSLIYGA